MLKLRDHADGSSEIERLTSIDGKGLHRTVKVGPCRLLAFGLCLQICSRRCGAFLGCSQPLLSLFRQVPFGRKICRLQAVGMLKDALVCRVRRFGLAFRSDVGGFSRCRFMKGGGQLRGGFVYLRACFFELGSCGTDLARKRANPRACVAAIGSFEFSDGGVCQFIRFELAAILFKAAHGFRDGVDHFGRDRR